MSFICNYCVICSNFLMTEWHIIVHSCRVPVLAAVVVAMRSCLLFWQCIGDIRVVLIGDLVGFEMNWVVCVVKWKLKDMNGVHTFMRKLHVLQSSSWWNCSCEIYLLSIVLLISGNKCLLWSLHHYWWFSIGLYCVIK